MEGFALCTLFSRIITNFDPSDVTAADASPLDIIQYQENPECCKHVQCSDEVNFTVIAL